MTPYEIVLVPFPFSDLKTVKRRPCLILSVVRPRGLQPHFVVAMMTSHISALVFPHDVVLDDWKEAGLPKKTIVRVAKLVPLQASMIEKHLGKNFDPRCFTRKGCVSTNVLPVPIIVPV